MKDTKVCWLENLQTNVISSDLSISESIAHAHVISNALNSLIGVAVTNMID